MQVPRLFPRSLFLPFHATVGIGLRASALMQRDIHPDYREVLFHDTAANAYFVIRSTAETTQTMEYEGTVYPYVTLDVSSQSHPFYTGKQSVSKNDGRVARFNKRFNRGVKR